MNGSDSSTSDALTGLFCLIGLGAGLMAIICLALLVIYLASNRRDPFTVSGQTAYSPTDAIRAVVDRYTFAGWQVTSRMDHNATFSIQRKPSCLVAILLFFFGFVPGLLYLFLAGGTMSATAYAQKRDDGGTEVTINGSTQGFGGRTAATTALSALAPFPATIDGVAVPPSDHDNQSDASASSVD